MYHVRAVTPTDVVRAGTKDISKIFQILYDVSAVYSPSNYSNQIDQSLLPPPLPVQNSGGSSGKKGALYPPNNVENSPSMLHSTTNSHSNSSLSTSTLHGATVIDNFSDSALGTTFRPNGGGGENEHSIRFNADSISVGSNDSADVNFFLLQVQIFYNKKHS